MNKIIFKAILLVTVLLQGNALYAQNAEKAPMQNNKWMAEVRSFKHSFLVKETEMTDEQSKEFLPLYTEMEEKVYQANREARNLEQDITMSQDNTDDDKYLIAATALSQVKTKEAEIENHYFQLFSKILTSKQMFLLKRAENRFAVEMLNHNKKSKKAKQQ